MEKFQTLKKFTKWISSVKWTSDSYTLQSFHKIGKDVIKSGELVCDTVYLNPLANFKQWYTPNNKKSRKNNCQIVYCYFN